MGTPEPRVLVLAGGLSPEREVSLRSGRRVLDALRAAGADAELRDADKLLLPALDIDPPDAAVVVVHSDDGSLRGVLELCGVPFVGSDPRTSRLAWDKPAAKTVLRAAGVATPDWVTLPEDLFTELGAAAVLDRVVQRLGLPLMVKPAHGGSGLGATVVREVGALPDAMVGCFAYAPTALVERYVPGVDIAVTVLGTRTLPAVEIVPHDGVYDYAARYTAGLTTWHVPARLDPYVSDEVARLALAAHEALGLRDLSRVDLIVDESGTPYVLELNTAPGMTETSLLPMAVHASGLDFGVLLVDLVRVAIERG